MAKANIGDTVRSKSNNPKDGYFHNEDGYDEFVVVSEEIDKDGIQWVWRCDINACDCMFSPCSYGMPDTNFDVIKLKE